ncbi:MAG: response regulator transcription factor [Candidatus Magnetomorum sp.]|nr:response regulator transcription factor [Candidatus Magnetomorum sp.]
MQKKSSVHILIVDDNQADLEYLQLLLDQHHISADCVNNPLEALKIVDSRKHDIMLLDIEMPQMNGYDLTLQIKKKAECNGIPIIFISALDQKNHIQKAFSIGAQDYIQKPIIPHEVIARINLRLDQSTQLKQLKKKQAVNKQNDEPIQSNFTKDKVNGEQLSMLNDILPRLNILKKKKMPQDRRKKIIDAIEKDLTENAFIFTQKIKKYGLTPTEKQIVLFIISGMSSKEIAETLYLSVQTIKTHRKNIRKKLGITNQQKKVLDFFLDS